MAAGRKTGGRAKGTPNKLTSDVKQAVIMAAEAAGGAGGMVGYLTLQAQENPGPFLTLLGKVIPTQLADADGGPLRVIIQRHADDNAS